VAAVQLTAAPGAGNSVSVTLRDDGADTALSCTIANAATSCTNPSTNATIAAASTLSIEVTSTLLTPATSVLVGLESR